MKRLDIETFDDGVVIVVVVVVYRWRTVELRLLTMAEENDNGGRESLAWTLWNRKMINPKKKRKVDDHDDENGESSMVNGGGFRWSW